MSKNMKSIAKIMELNAGESQELLAAVYADLEERITGWEPLFEDLKQASRGFLLTGTPDSATNVTLLHTAFVIALESFPGEIAALDVAKKMHAILITGAQALGENYAEQIGESAAVRSIALADALSQIAMSHVTDAAVNDAMQEKAQATHTH